MVAVNLIHYNALWDVLLAMNRILLGAPLAVTVPLQVFMKMIYCSIQPIFNQYCL